ncbi:MAG TPA: hypothetical protein VMD09_05760 [Solirubrobacteraceae bacterium]|nr:hypothetical protein [Solirubrobacteraceae bacterium]
MSAVAEAQQKDNLCGPFHAARILREAGGADDPLDQDLVALHAGTELPERELGPQVPPGAVNRRDYRFELPRVDESRAGTSAAGLAAAIAELSGGRLRCVPASGDWSASVVEQMVLRGRSLDARLLANLQTGLLWGSRPPIESLLSVLAGDEPGDGAPAAEWDVGHFVELVQVVRGHGGALVIVRDSYPSLGWNGVHLQPPAALAAALLRGDGRGGGILAVAVPEAVPAVEELIAGLGLASQMWDNCTGGETPR